MAPAAGIGGLTHALGQAGLPAGNQPPPQPEQFPGGEDRPIDRLVAPGQLGNGSALDIPLISKALRTQREQDSRFGGHNGLKRQVDVEVVRALFRAAACQIGQRATAALHR